MTPEGIRLSHLQQRAFRFLRDDPRRPLRIACEVDVDGDVDEVRLARAVRAVVARHEILRAGLYLGPLGVPALVIGDEPAVRWSEGAPGAPLADGDAAPAPGAPALHASIARRPGGARLYLALPALCADLRSLPVLVAEIARAYAGEAPAEAPLQHPDAAAALDELLSPAPPARAPLAAPARWPFARARPDEQADPIDGRAPCPIPEASWRALRQLAAEGGAPPAAALLACWHALLERLVEGGALSLGASFDGRTDALLAGAVGPYSRFLPVPPPPRPHLGARARIRALAASLRELSDRQEQLSWEIAPDRVGAYPEAAFEHLDLAAPISAGGARWLVLGVLGHGEPFRLKLRALGRGDHLEAEVHHDARWIAPGDARLLAERLATLAQAAAEQPDAPMSDLPLVGPGERALLARLALGPSAPPGPSPCAAALFEQQAERSPAAEAARMEGRSLTYRDLDRHADHLAERLRAAGAGSGAVVGVLLPRSLERVVAVIGALKAGATLLPLEPDHPPERLRFLLGDARPRALVSAPGFARGAAWPGPVLPVDLERDAPSAARAPAAWGPEHPAYVLYTSGSTGLPKGVVVPQRALTNHLLWRQAAFPLGPGDRFLHKAAFTFDIALWELLAPLVAGAAVVLSPPGAERDPAALVRAMQRDSITVLHVSPALLGPLLDEEGAAGCRSLRHVFCGGEQLPAALRARFRVVLGAALHHQYGPTEAAIDSTCWTCAPDDHSDPIPIGWPIAGAAVFVVDAQGRPAPIGTPGEIWIGGPGIALGYLGRPELTAARFIPDPFSAEPGTRAYRTGDRGRLRHDGALEFLGRLDRQIKIRGHRVEPAEIEHALRAHPAVRDARVVPGLTGGSGRAQPAPGDSPGPGALTLLAAVVPADGQAPSPRELTAFLAARLPEPMIPAQTVVLDRLPLDAHGKVDAAALARMAAAERGRDPADAVLRTDLEELLVQAFQDALGASAVGVDDTFFACGGDSIRVLQLVRALERRGLAVAVAEVFEHQTARALARALRARRASEPAAPAPPAPDLRRALGALVPPDAEDAYPLTAMQEIMVRAYAADAARQGTYHVQASYTLTDERLDEDLLAEAIRAVCRRHPALRTHLLPDSPAGPAQIVRPDPPPVLRRDLSGLAPGAQEAAIDAIQRDDRRSPFLLDPEAPLTRFHLLRRSPTSTEIFVANHHAVRDGWSRVLMLHEILETYTLARRGQRPDPARPAGLYREHVAMERELAASENAARFWRQQLAEHRPHARCPRADAQGAPAAGQVLHALDPALLAALSRRARALGVSLKALALSAFVRLVGARDGREVVTIGVVANGRSPRLSAPLSTLGLFWNIAPLCCRADGADPAAHARLVQRRLVEIEPWAGYPLPRLWVGAAPEEQLYATFNYVRFHHERAVPGLCLRETRFHDRFHFALNLVFAVSASGDEARLRLEIDPEYVGEREAEALVAGYAAQLGREASARDPAAA